jgi:hypothetical protein
MTSEPAGEILEGFFPFFLGRGNRKKADLGRF